MRPVHLDLFRIEFPVGAIVSILHRVSGVVLAVMLPAMVILLNKSISSEQAYGETAVFLAGPIGRSWVALCLLCLIHHVLAGLRHLLLDIGIGSSLSAARAQAWTVLTLDGLALVWIVLT